MKIRIQGKFRKHLGGTLGVSNVGVDLLLASQFGDVRDMGWLVVDSHFVEREVPEFFVFGGESFMLKGISISSAVR